MRGINVCKKSDTGKFDSENDCVTSGCEERRDEPHNEQVSRVKCKELRDTLGSLFPKDCSKEKEWKQCYRKGALTYHPDKYTGADEAKRKKMLQEIQDCHDLFRGTT